jgi:hypothetical protein
LSVLKDRLNSEESILTIKAIHEAIEKLEK